MKSPDPATIEDEAKPTPLSERASASSKIWLHAWEDPAADLRLNPACLLSSDLLGDNDHKIVAALRSRSLRVYKGKTIITEIALLDEPTAVVALYPELSTPQTPMIAVASGCHLFIYRNLRPFYKFTVPITEAVAEEQAIWRRILDEPGSVDAAIAELVALHQAGKTLTNRSRCLMSIQNDAMRTTFIESVREKPLGSIAPITCLAALNKSSEDDRAISLAVLGLESGQVLILNQTGMKVAKQIDIGAVPAFIDTAGLFEVNYRVVVGCRNNRVVTIKNGKVTGNPIETMTDVCGVLVLIKHVIVGCIGNVFHGYHVKGHQLFSVSLPAPISAMTKFQIRSTSNLQGSIIALQNGEVRFYESNQLLTTICCSSAVTAMRFGQFGREDATAILVQQTGAIVVKILQRNAQLDAKPSSGIATMSEQDVPLPIPKRTQLYVDQMNRERDQAVLMHRTFQRDLARLRLTTAQTFIKVIGDGHGMMSNALASNLRLNAQVLGMGPKFKIRLSFKNSGSSAVLDVMVVLMFDVDMYEMSKSLLRIPVIVPAVNFHTDVDVSTSEKNAGSREVRIAVTFQKATAPPIINAVLVMPPVQF